MDLTDFDAVDPGVSYYAIASFRAGCLVSCSFRDVVERPSSRIQRWCIIEKPVVYERGRVRKSDIVDLAFSAGLVAGGYAQHRCVSPAEWKGQVPKSVHQRRILGRLSPSEASVLAGALKKHLVHVLDAVGIGLWALRRL